MDTLKIDILNPKARKLLEDLEAQQLISIQRDQNNPFEHLITKLRSKGSESHSLDEITAEVESVRAKRYGK